MSYIPDLAAVSYSEIEGPIRAVGWLESGRDITRGTVDPEFVRRLMALIERPVWGYLSFGMHYCGLCAEEGRCGPHCCSSQAELLVPAPNCVYETPIWIGHYVLGHSYQPPAEFCRAVMSCPEPGSDEFAEALLAHLPGLASMLTPKIRSLFVGSELGAEYAQWTLRPDPDHGTDKRHLHVSTPDGQTARSQKRKEDSQSLSEKG